MVGPAFKPGDNTLEDAPEDPFEDVPEGDLEDAGLGSIGFMSFELFIMSRSVRRTVCFPKSWPAFANPMFNRRSLN